MQGVQIPSLSRPLAMEAAEPEEKLSVERLFYDNLLLLGFEAGALTKKYGASLGADMFRRSNPKAMEIVVYFLLLKIAPEQTKDVRAAVTFVS